MKRNMKSDIKVVGSGEGGRNVGKNVNIKKKKKRVNVKNNYRRIGNKLDNDVNADITQLERNNNKCYALAFRCI